MLLMLFFIHSSVVKYCIRSCFQSESCNTVQIMSAVQNWLEMSRFPDFDKAAVDSMPLLRIAVVVESSM